MAEQVTESQVQPKAEGPGVDTSPQPTINYAELTAYLDKYIDAKLQTHQKVAQTLQQISPGSNALNPQEEGSWEEGLNSLKSQLAKTLDVIKDLLDYDDYDNAAFDERYNSNAIKRTRQFWLHAHTLGGEKMANMLVDKIRRTKKDYTIFNKDVIYK